MENKNNLQKLDGEPGMHDVSKVAMGQEPEQNMESEFEDNQEEFMGKLYGKDKAHALNCIEDAYAQLFESLSIILKSK